MVVVEVREQLLPVGSARYVLGLLPNTMWTDGSWGECSMDSGPMMLSTGHRFPI